ncbi:hypothetical protein CDIK_3480 [Cucumispora dikerogammari]|nr:hypothetical protein CDIK_3480 [Cucumispora dikerogammari]
MKGGEGYYICYKRTCRTKMSLFKNTFFSEPNVEVHLFLRVILGYYIYLDHFQLEIFFDLSRNIIIKIRKKITDLLKPLFSVSITCDKTVAEIGGPRTYVQVDETDICKGGLILNPSSAYGDIKKAQWLVSGVIEGLKKEFFICLFQIDKQSH